MHGCSSGYRQQKSIFETRSGRVFSWYFSFEPRKMETSGGMKERLLFGYWRCGIKWQCFPFSYFLLLYFLHCFFFIYCYHFSIRHTQICLGRPFTISTRLTPSVSSMSLPTKFYRMQHHYGRRRSASGFRRGESVKARASTRTGFSTFHFIFAYFCTCHSMGGE